MLIFCVSISIMILIVAQDFYPKETFNLCDSHLIGDI